GALAGQTGRIDLAVDLLHRAIALNPREAGYHSNLAKLLCDQGRFDEAILACRQALDLNPNLADAHNNLANAFYGKGQLDEAIAAYRQALKIRPDHPDALKNLGVVLDAKGDHDRAIEVYRQLLRFKPDDAEAHNDLGNHLARKGRLDEAIDSYRRAIELAPDFASAHSNLGQALCDRGNTQEAIAACQRAIGLNPDFAEAHNVLGLALTAARRFDEAGAELQRALQLKPGFIWGHNNLGAALYQAGRIDESLVEYRRALELDPDDPQILTNLGLGLWATGRQDEAIAAYRRAIRFKNEFSEAHYNLSVSLLLKGEFEDGWREYEYRLHGKDYASRPRICSQPQWNGEELHGRTILLDAEQGYGDVIQFIRYVPDVVSRGGRVILMGYVEQVRLLQCVPGIAQIFTRNPPPPFDVYCPLASLPRALGTRLESIPANVPYLKADPAVAEAWGKKLGPRTDRLRVGLVWAGRPTHKRDRERSVSLSQLAPLAAAGGITFYSLQIGESASQATHPPPGMELLDLTAELRDFAETAGLISHLDLVVTVDTSVAHLAGAMGKPVWVMLSFVPDWRWLLDRGDSPWYPSMRLFRQTTPGQWDDVVQRVAHEIGRHPRSASGAP
ncbi:MAG: tetratricopeptide repeat protein, partial [Tepidisphaeraceae bacterium]